MSKYTELKKNFLGIRGLLRHFFIYGDMSRSKAPDKTSVRSYDDDLRRIKSWFKDIIKSKSVDGEKRYSVCVDPSAVSSNPFFSAYKYKSFTDKDINLHFLLLSILENKELINNGEHSALCTRAWNPLHQHFSSSAPSITVIFRIANPDIQCGRIANPPERHTYLADDRVVT